MILNQMKQRREEENKKLQELFEKALQEYKKQKEEEK